MLGGDVKEFPEKLKRAKELKEKREREAMRREIEITQQKRQSQRIQKVLELEQRHVDL